MTADQSDIEGGRVPPLRAPRPTSTEIAALALLGLVPILFVRGSGDAFEPVKAALLATGAAFLLATALISEFARAEREGLGAWWRSAGSRTVSAIRKDPFGAAVLIFLLSSVISTIASIRPELSLLGIPSRPAGLMTACATAAVFFASRSASATPRWIERVALVSCLAAAVAAAYALVQLAGLDPVEWAWTATFDDRRRVPGTLGHPNHLGTYLAMTLPLALLLARRARSGRVRAGWALLIAAALFVLAITLSRGAWVAMAVAAFVYGALSLLSVRVAHRSARPAAAGSSDPAAPSVGSTAPPARRRTGLILAVASAALAVFLLPLLTPLGPSLVTRIRQIADIHAPSTQSRLYLWRAGLEMLSDHPLLGVGTDAFAAAYPRYRTPESSRLEWNSTSSKAHSEPIQIGATQGALGLLAALLVVACAARSILRLAGGRDPAVREGAAAVGAALAAWGVSNLAGFTVVATGSLAAALGGWGAGMVRAGGARDAGAARETPGPLHGSLREARPGATPLAGVVGALIALALWVPLVLTPWRASHAASRGIELPLGSPVREQALERASAIAPWDERYASELGRTLLARSFFAPDPAHAWAYLARARSAFERAARIAPESAEDLALLARVLAAQGALRPDLVPVRQVIEELSGVLAADSTSASVLELAAQGYLEVGFHAAGHRTALRCATLYPDFAHPMATLGTLALEEGRYADAADTLAIAVRRQWHDDVMAQASTRGNLAFAYLMQGSPREAWEEAGRALHLNPMLEEARRVRTAAAAILRSGGG
jgi:O-antigen ligase